MNRKVLSLFLVCAIIMLNLPYAIAEEMSEQDLSMIYETDTVDLASYSFQEINEVSRVAQSVYQLIRCCI